MTLLTPILLIVIPVIIWAVIWHQTCKGYDKEKKSFPQAKH